MIKRTVFLHASKIGGLIYALPTIQIICSKSNTRALIVCTQEQVIMALKVLLLSDRFIYNVIHISDLSKYLERFGQWELDWFDLEQFRKFDMGMDARDSLPICYAKAFGVDKEVKELIKNRWIMSFSRLYPKSLSIGTIINYTDRYQDKLFSWKEVILDSPKPYYFAGTSEEYKTFTYRYPKISVEHIYFKNYHEAAVVLLRARMFIGNQSSLFALAEAMKIPRKLIEAPSPPNCRITPSVVVNKTTRKIHRVLSLMWLIVKVIFNKHY